MFVRLCVCVCDGVCVCHSLRPKAFFKQQGGREDGVGLCPTKPPHRSWENVPASFFGNSYLRALASATWHNEPLLPSPTPHGELFTVCVSRLRGPWTYRSRSSREPLARPTMSTSALTALIQKKPRSTQGSTRRLIHLTWLLNLGL